MTEFQTRAFRRLYASNFRRHALDLALLGTSCSDAELAAADGQGGLASLRSVASKGISELRLATDEPSASTIIWAPFGTDRQSRRTCNREESVTAPRLIWTDRDVAGLSARLLCSVAPLCALACLFLFR